MSEDLSKKRELNDDARELLASNAFTHAILELRKRMFDELMAAATIEQKVELICSMKALERIPTELTVIMNDYKMALNRQKSHA